MTQTYNFEMQKRRGDAGASRLDAFFSDNFSIELVGMSDEWRGIDRRFKNKESGKSFTVEYKTDLKAPHTHNFFVETISNDVSNRPGWAFTCEADYLMAYVPLDEIVYIVKPSNIKRVIRQWVERYGTKKAKNDGYNTIGVAVPLREFESIADEVISL